MKRTRSVITILLFVVVSCFAIGFCIIKPVVVVKTSPSGTLESGQTANFTVVVDQTVSGSQGVTITSSPSNAFSSLPSTVTVTNGNSTVGFQGTLNSSYTGSFVLTATCNGNSAYSAEYDVIEPGEGG